MPTISLFIGPIGDPHDIEPIFQNMAKRCELALTLGPSAHTNALEFENGKVLLGKLKHVMDIGWDSILKRIPKKKLASLLDQSDLFACTNWTMLPKMTDLWKKIIKEILPSLKTKNPQRILFVDLADPAKRTSSDIKEALITLKKLQSHYSVALGLNEAEAERVASPQR